ncbi:MAG: GNAT family N-acetyltransferase [Roseibium sp.]|uniref:GNAT family N-acetyltransferase n=1 Tax=Roseibium sp. TaxID=1936156 RepID=UPI00262F9447|nr:GNAT family N-acetyltransferase [Roseibium sp.]MCV0424593.1 GNAT family N-acetyltransferase [Roseibium sp.]
MLAQEEVDSGSSYKSLRSVRIRLAENEDDLLSLRPLSQAFHSESRYSSVPYSFEKRDKLFQRAIDEPKYTGLLIAESGGKPVGFLFCTVGEYIVGTGNLFTTIHSFYVDQTLRGSLAGGRTAARLLQGVIKWSKVRGVDEILAHVTSGFDLKRIDRFFRHAGFKTIGGNYALSLQVSDGASG